MEWNYAWTCVYATAMTNDHVIHAEIGKTFLEEQELRAKHDAFESKFKREAAFLEELARKLRDCPELIGPIGYDMVELETSLVADRAIKVRLSQLDNHLRVLGVR